MEFRTGVSCNVDLIAEYEEMLMDKLRLWKKSFDDKVLNVILKRQNQ